MYSFDEKIGRLAFLKKLGAAGGTAVAAAAATGPGCASFGAREHEIVPNLVGEKSFGRAAGSWVPSCCNMCGGQSGIMVHVVDGIVQKIEPNHWNPNNYSNISTDFFDGYSEEFGCADGGSICAKGNAGIMQLYDPDRVRQPLKRTNPDRSPGADPGFQAISWKQAITEIAAKMKALREGGDAHKLLWISEDHSFTHVQGDFMELFGSPNYGMHSNLCDVARKASFRCVVGDDRPLADFLQSKYIMLWGWNPSSAIKWVYLPRILTQAIERGARLVVVDPYLSDTAAKAHEWVPLRPGTDGALALAIGHVIVRDGLYDADFVKDWTVGFDEYAAYVKDKTPRWAEGITSVKAKTIERLAREVATTKPACIDVWSGPGQHSNGVQGGRAIAALGALVGGYERPGTMLLPNKKGNKHIHVHPDADAEKTLKQPRFDDAKKYPLGHKSGVYTQLFENLAEGKGPYTPEMMVCVFQNPMMSVPGTDTVVRGLQKLKTFVVVDTMLSETAMMADYVIPGTTYLERYDLNTHWVTWPVLGLRQPVVKPLFNQLAEYEFVAALGRAVGLKDHDGNSFFETGPLSNRPIKDLTAWYEEYLSKELVNGAPKITLQQLKDLPGAVWIDRGGTRYEKYAQKIEPEKLGKAHRDGNKLFDKPGGSRIGTVLNGQAVRGFFTPSGKVELVSGWLAEKTTADGQAIDALPVYTPRDWQPDAEFPLYLINWKEANHTHSRTQNNPWLLEIKPFNPLIIHPDTAQRLGIADDQDVWVESKFGKVRAKVRVSRRIHPEVVGLQHGFGHTALGRNAKGRGTSDAALRPAKSDALSGQSLHKETCVKVYRA